MCSQLLSLMSCSEFFTRRNRISHSVLAAAHIPISANMNETLPPHQLNIAGGGRQCTDGQSLCRSFDTEGRSGRQICQTEVQRGVQAHGTQGGDTLLAELSGPWWNEWEQIILVTPGSTIVRPVDPRWSRPNRFHTEVTQLTKKVRY